MPDTHGLYDARKGPHQSTHPTMSRIVVTASALVLSTLVHFAQAQSKHLASVEETRRAAEAIVASMAASNTNGALAQFSPLSVIQGPELEVFRAQVAGAQEKLLREFGPPTGYEYIRQEPLGTRVVRHQLLVFHEKAPMLWNIIFFRQKGGWAITHLHFDGNALKFFP